VATFSERAAVMRSAADSLEAGVAGAAAPVEARHARVFAAVAAKFGSLCAGLLPALVGPQGVRVRACAWALVRERVRAC
jgi:hypothetical protein